MNRFSLKDRVALVTGACGLIGKAICDALAEAGSIVVATDIIENEYISKTYHFIKADITKEDDIENLKNKIFEKNDNLHILVNNASINDMFENPKAAFEQSKFENYPLELWEKSIRVNLTGTFLCSKILGREMINHKKGSIINIASTYGINAPDQSLYINDKGEQIFFKPPAYSASKGGVIMFTKYLAAYWGNNGIRVNALTPGGVENNQDEHFIKKYSEKTPLKRMATIEDYKGAIVFLASDASSYMTGANLVIDGGWTCW